MVITSISCALMLSVTDYNIAIHLLYKKLRNPMDKLLTLYSILLALLSAAFFMIVTFIYKFPISNEFNHMCHIVKLVHTGSR